MDDYDPACPTEDEHQFAELDLSQVPLPPPLPGQVTVHTQSNLQPLSPSPPHLEKEEDRKGKRKKKKKKRQEGSRSQLDEDVEEEREDDHIIQDNDENGQGEAPLLELVTDVESDGNLKIKTSKPSTLVSHLPSLLNADTASSSFQTSSIGKSSGRLHFKLAPDPGSGKAKVSFQLKKSFKSTLRTADEEGGEEEEELAVEEEAKQLVEKTVAGEYIPTRFKVSKKHEMYRPNQEGPSLTVVFNSSSHISAGATVSQTSCATMPSLLMNSSESVGPVNPKLEAHVDEDLKASGIGKKDGSGDEQEHDMEGSGGKRDDDDNESTPSVKGKRIERDDSEMKIKDDSQRELREDERWSVKRDFREDEKEKFGKVRITRQSSRGDRSNRNKDEDSSSRRTREEERRRETSENNQRNDDNDKSDSRRRSSRYRKGEEEDKTEDKRGLSNFDRRQIKDEIDKPSDDHKRSQRSEETSARDRKHKRNSCKSRSTSKERRNESPSFSLSKPESTDNDQLTSEDQGESISASAKSDEGSSDKIEANAPTAEDSVTFQKHVKSDATSSRANVKEPLEKIPTTPQKLVIRRSMDSNDFEVARNDLANDVGVKRFSGRSKLSKRKSRDKKRNDSFSSSKSESEDDNEKAKQRPGLRRKEEWEQQKVSRVAADKERKGKARTRASSAEDEDVTMVKEKEPEVRKPVKSVYITSLLSEPEEIVDKSSLGHRKKDRKGRDSSSSSGSEEEGKSRQVKNRPRSKEEKGAKSKDRGRTKCSLTEEEENLAEATEEQRSESRKSTLKSNFVLEPVLPPEEILVDVSALPGKSKWEMDDEEEEAAEVDTGRVSRWDDAKPEIPTFSISDLARFSGRSQSDVLLKSSLRIYKPVESSSNEDDPVDHKRQKDKKKHKNKEGKKMKKKKKKHESGGGGSSSSSGTEDNVEMHKKRKSSKSEDNCDAREVPAGQYHGDLKGKDEKPTCRTELDKSKVVSYLRDYSTKEETSKSKVEIDSVKLVNYLKEYSEKMAPDSASKESLASEKEPPVLDETKKLEFKTNKSPAHNLEKHFGEVSPEKVFAGNEEPEHNKKMQVLYSPEAPMCAPSTAKESSLDSLSEKKSEEPVEENENKAHDEKISSRSSSCESRKREGSRDRSVKNREDSVQQVYGIKEARNRSPSVALSESSTAKSSQKGKERKSSERNRRDRSKSSDRNRRNRSKSLEKNRRDRSRSSERNRKDRSKSSERNRRDRSKSFERNRSDRSKSLERSRTERNKRNYRNQSHSTEKQNQSRSVEMTRGRSRSPSPVWRNRDRRRRSRSPGWRDRGRRGRSRTRSPDRSYSYRRYRSPARDSFGRTRQDRDRWRRSHSGSGDQRHHGGSDDKDIASKDQKRSPSPRAGQKISSVVEKDKRKKSPSPEPEIKIEPDFSLIDLSTIPIPGEIPLPGEEMKVKVQDEAVNTNQDSSVDILQDEPMDISDEEREDIDEEASNANIESSETLTLKARAPDVELLKTKTEAASKPSLNVNPATLASGKERQIKFSISGGSKRLKPVSVTGILNDDEDHEGNWGKENFKPLVSEEEKNVSTEKDKLLEESSVDMKKTCKDSERTNEDVSDRNEAATSAEQICAKIESPKLKEQDKDDDSNEETKVKTKISKGGNLEDSSPSHLPRLKFKYVPLWEMEEKETKPVIEEPKKKTQGLALDYGSESSDSDENTMTLSKSRLGQSPQKEYTEADEDNKNIRPEFYKEDEGSSLGESTQDYEEVVKRDQESKTETNDNQAKNEDCHNQVDVNGPGIKDIQEDICELHKEEKDENGNEDTGYVVSEEGIKDNNDSVIENLSTETVEQSVVPENSELVVEIIEITGKELTESLVEKPVSSDKMEKKSYNETSSALPKQSAAEAYSPSHPSLEEDFDNAVDEPILISLVEDKPKSQNKSVSSATTGLPSRANPILPVITGLSLTCQDVSKPLNGGAQPAILTALSSINVSSIPLPPPLQQPTTSKTISQIIKAPVPAQSPAILPTALPGLSGLAAPTPPQPVPPPSALQTIPLSSIPLPGLPPPPPPLQPFVTPVPPPHPIVAPVPPPPQPVGAPPVLPPQPVGAAPVPPPQPVVTAPVAPPQAVVAASVLSQQPIVTAQVLTAQPVVAPVSSPLPVAAPVPAPQVIPKLPSTPAFGEPAVTSVASNAPVSIVPQISWGAPATQLLQSVAVASVPTNQTLQVTPVTPILQGMSSSVLKGVTPVPPPGIALPVVTQLSQVTLSSAPVIGTSSAQPQISTHPAAAPIKFRISRFHQGPAAIQPVPPPSVSIPTIEPPAIVTPSLWDVSFANSSTVTKSAAATTAIVSTVQSQGVAQEQPVVSGFLQSGPIECKAGTKLLSAPSKRPKISSILSQPKIEDPHLLETLGVTDVKLKTRGPTESSEGHLPILELPKILTKSDSTLHDSAEENTASFSSNQSEKSVEFSRSLLSGDLFPDAQNEEQEELQSYENTIAEKAIPETPAENIRETEVAGASSFSSKHEEAPDQYSHILDMGSIPLPGELPPPPPVETPKPPQPLPPLPSQPAPDQPAPPPPPCSGLSVLSPQQLPLPSVESSSSSTPSVSSKSQTLGSLLAERKKRFSQSPLAIGMLPKIPLTQSPLAIGPLPSLPPEPEVESPATSTQPSKKTLSSPAASDSKPKFFMQLTSTSKQKNPIPEKETTKLSSSSSKISIVLKSKSVVQRTVVPGFEDEGSDNESDLEAAKEDPSDLDNTILLAFAEDKEETPPPPPSVPPVSMQMLEAVNEEPLSAREEEPVLKDESKEEQKQKGHSVSDIEAFPVQVIMSSRKEEETPASSWPEFAVGKRDRREEKLDRDGKRSSDREDRIKDKDRKKDRRGSREREERRGSREREERRGSRDREERRGSRERVGRRGSRERDDRRGSREREEKRRSRELERDVEHDGKRSSWGRRDIEDKRRDSSRKREEETRRRDEYDDEIRKNVKKEKDDDSYDDRQSSRKDDWGGTCRRRDEEETYSRRRNRYDDDDYGRKRSRDEEDYHRRKNVDNKDDDRKRRRYDDDSRVSRRSDRDRSRSRDRSWDRDRSHERDRDRSDRGSRPSRSSGKHSHRDRSRSRSPGRRRDRDSSRERYNRSLDRDQSRSPSRERDRSTSSSTRKRDSKSFKEELLQELSKSSSKTDIQDDLYKVAVIGSTTQSYGSEYPSDSSYSDGSIFTAHHGTETTGVYAGVDPNYANQYPPSYDHQQYSTPWESQTGHDGYNHVITTQPHQDIHSSYPPVPPDHVTAPNQYPYSSQHPSQYPQQAGYPPASQPPVDPYISQSSMPLQQQPPPPPPPHLQHQLGPHPPHIPLDQHGQPISGHFATSQTQVSQPYAHIAPQPHFQSHAFSQDTQPSFTPLEPQYQVHVGPGPRGPILPIPPRGPFLKTPLIPRSSTETSGFGSPRFASPNVTSSPTLVKPMEGKPHRSRFSSTDDGSSYGSPVPKFPLSASNSPFDSPTTSSAKSSEEPSFESSSLAEPSFETSTLAESEFDSLKSEGKQFLKSLSDGKKEDATMLEEVNEPTVSSSGVEDSTGDTGSDSGTDSSSQRPLKVKSRWRRSSEAEAVVDTSTPPQVSTPPLPQTKKLQNQGSTSSPTPELSPKDMRRTRSRTAAEETAATASVEILPPPDKQMKLEEADQLEKEDSDSRLSEDTSDDKENEEQDLESLMRRPDFPKFEIITENIHFTERKKSKSMKRMTCDCTTSRDDRAMGISACGSDCLNRMLMIECGSRCICGDYCTNRRFQKKQYSMTAPFKTGDKGWGLRAEEDMEEKGTFIMEYVGELLDYEEFVRRTRQYSKSGLVHHYFMALNGDEVIDATQKGSISRFINHSCDPNCETQKWTVNGELRVGFFTRKPVKKGEELTFDYQFEHYGEPQKCYCGAENCRGYIGLVKSPTRNKRKEKKKREIFKDELLEEDIEKLSLLDGMRNKNHVLDLCRLMVRAEKVQHRMAILKILQDTTETACLRLFLDYHGLPLFWSWMADIGTADYSDETQELKMLMLSVLKSLPVTNKTILKESKILDIVDRWAVAAVAAARKPPPPPPTSTTSTIPTATITVVEDSGNVTAVTELDEEEPTEAALAVDDVKANTSSEPEPSTSSSSNTSPPSSPSPLPLPPLSNITPVSILASAKDTKESKRKRRVTFAEVPVETAFSPDPVEDVEDSGITSSTPGAGEDGLEDMRVADETVDGSSQRAIIGTDIPGEATACGDSYFHLEGADLVSFGLKSEETLLSHIADSTSQKELSDMVDNAGMNSDTESSDTECFIKDPIASLAAECISQWSSLKEVFKIPKKDRVEERKRTERELDVLSKKEPEISDPYAKWKRSRTRFISRKRSLEEDEKKSSQPKMSKEERRQRFEAQVKAEDELAAQAAAEELQRQHEAFILHQQRLMEDPQYFYYHQQQGDPNFVGLDPSMIPPESLIDPITGQPIPPEVLIDPHTGQPVLDPSTAQPVIDPTTGQPVIDLNTGQPLMHHPHQIDPNTGQPIVHSHLIDPQTGHPLHHIDPHTGQPIHPTDLLIGEPLLTHDTITGQPQIDSQAIPSHVDPLTGQSLSQPVQIDPQTGQPTPGTALVQQGSAGFSHQPAIQHQSVPTQNQAGSELDFEDEVPPPPSPPTAPVSKLPPNWKTAKDDEGRIYYYHAFTRRTQWEMPSWDENDDDSDDMDLDPTLPEESKGKKKTTTAAADTSSEVARKIKDQFRTKMSNFIVLYLNPYRKPDCKIGRINSTDDFKYLARKLTHHVMSKELKHCRHVEDLEVNENVKAKAKDYVRKYMSKFGAVFKKSSSPQPDESSI